MTEKHTFDCTPREARRIAENLRYTAAARELANAVDEAITRIADGQSLRDTLEDLKSTLDTFRTIADE